MRLLIADDHPIVLAGIRQTLEQEADFDVVGVAESGPAVLESIERLVPDVLLLDLRLPGVDGFGCLRSIQDHHPELKVVVLSVIADPEQIQAAFECGACGFVLKTIDPSDLASAIRQAIEQTAYHALGLPALDETAETEPGGLTAREATVMRAVARTLESGDRQGALGHRADRQVPSDQHLPAARRRQPHRGCLPGLRERPRRSAGDLARAEPDRRGRVA